MPLRQRQRIAPTDDWCQLGLLARAPGQRSYELFRPVVLFGQSPAERGIGLAYRDEPLVQYRVTYQLRRAVGERPRRHPADDLRAGRRWLTTTR